MQTGRILFVKVPGAASTRILTGTGAAEIKGTTVIIQVDDDGSEFSLYSGAMTVSNTDGTQTVELKPRQSVRVTPDGKISEIRPAPPLPNDVE